MATPKQPILKYSSRELGVLKSPVVPLSELWQTIQNSAKEATRAREDQEKRINSLVVDICNRVHDIDRLLRIEENSASEESPSELTRRLQSVYAGLKEVIESYNYKMLVFEGELLKNINSDNVERMAFNPKEGVKENTISETLRPAVLLDEVLLQTAQVVVVGPKQDTNES